MAALRRAPLLTVCLLKKKRKVYFSFLFFILIFKFCAILRKERNTWIIKSTINIEGTIKKDMEIKRVFSEVSWINPMKNASIVPKEMNENKNQYPDLPTPYIRYIRVREREREREREKEKRVRSR